MSYVQMLPDDLFALKALLQVQNGLISMDEFRAVLRMQGRAVADSPQVVNRMTEFFLLILQ